MTQPPISSLESSTLKASSPDANSLNASSTKSSYLIAQGLRKTYQTAEQKIEVLKGVDFTVNRGESLALVGRSGSGKSSLLNILSGIDVPDAGSVTLDGLEMTQLSASRRTQWRAENVGLVFQQFQLIPYFTALENVMLPMDILSVPTAQSHSRALELLTSVGLAERSSHFPAQLSGGECQRVAIARALANRPKIIFADEPSGSLDERTGNEVLDLFFELQKREGATLLFVTHSPELARRCDKTFRMESGRLYEEV